METGCDAVAGASVVAGALIANFEPGSATCAMVRGHCGEAKVLLGWDRVGLV